MASDLMKTIGALFDKREVERPPYRSMWVINRFLAWIEGLAPAVAEVSRLRDDEMAWYFWRGALPRQANAPRLGYAAPKRQPGAEDVVEAIMATSSLSRREAEDAVDLAELRGIDLATEYGIEVVP